jgi:hypothetical protein
MPTFQLLLHTTDIRVELDGDPIPCIGFYTSRRAKARTSEEAFEQIMKEFDTDPEMLDLFQAAHEQGLVILIPWWKAILPWKTPGLIFYPADEENDFEHPKK